MAGVPARGLPAGAALLPRAPPPLRRLTLDVGAAYVVLALRLARHVDGLVDSYAGDPAVASAVAAEPLRSPVLLRGDVAALADRVRSEEEVLGAARARVLLGRLSSLSAVAGTAAGQRLSWKGEAEAVFGVLPSRGAPAAYEAAHTELAEVLPGTGSLAERLRAWRASVLCPPGLVGAALEALAVELGARTRALWPLPPDERVVWEVVGEAPWAGSARYLGGHATRVAVSGGLPVRLSHLPSLVAHEAYPGHHTAACRHDALLVRGRGQAEHTVSVVLTPDSLVAEGAADHALAALLPEGWGALAEEVYRGLGLGFDGVLAERVTRALAGLSPVRQDAAMALAGPGGRRAALSLLREAGLMSADRASQALEFLGHPLWRTYIATYVEGGRLVGAWLAAAPPGVDARDRYARLLDEALHPADLARDLAAGR